MLNDDEKGAEHMLKQFPFQDITDHLTIVFIQVLQSL